MANKELEMWSSFTDEERVERSQQRTSGKVEKDERGNHSSVVNNERLFVNLIVPFAHSVVLTRSFVKDTPLSKIPIFSQTFCCRIISHLF